MTLVLVCFADLKEPLDLQNLLEHQEQPAIRRVTPCPKLEEHLKRERLRRQLVLETQMRHPAQ